MVLYDILRYRSPQDAGRRLYPQRRLRDRGMVHLALEQDDRAALPSGEPSLQTSVRRLLAGEHAAHDVVGLTVFCVKVVRDREEPAPKVPEFGDEGHARHQTGLVQVRGAGELHDDRTM